MNIPTRKKSKSLRPKLLAAKQRFLGGKALKRIQYFETQRALTRTTLVRGFVTSQPVHNLWFSRKPPSRRGPRPVAEYAKADRAKARMIPTRFAGNLQLPVWRPLGPNLIPKGQTYGTGGNNKPPVSGRCSGHLCFTHESKPPGSLFRGWWTLGNLGSRKNMATVNGPAADAVDGRNL